jgi:hypothetical protein
MIAMHEKDGKICRMKNITEKPSGSFSGGFFMEESRIEHEESEKSMLYMNFKR